MCKYVYAVSDGFGLGVDILCLFSIKNEDRRVIMERLGYIQYDWPLWSAADYGMQARSVSDATGSVKSMDIITLRTVIVRMDETNSFFAHSRSLDAL